MTEKIIAFELAIVIAILTLEAIALGPRYRSAMVWLQGVRADAELERTFRARAALKGQQRVKAAGQWQGQDREERESLLHAVSVRRAPDSAAPRKESTMKMRISALFVLTVLLALGAIVTSSYAGPPLPESPDGKTVRPTVSYGFQWFATDGSAGQLRVPVHGKRRYTPRTGGPMGETATVPVATFLYNPDDPGGIPVVTHLFSPCPTGLVVYWTLTGTFMRCVYGVTWDRA